MSKCETDLTLPLLCVAGDDGGPSAKKPRTNPKLSKKLHPLLSPKQAAGQEFVHQQLQELVDTQAVLSAWTTQAANNRAIYKQKCALYQSDVRRQDKHNYRLLQMHKINSENAARASLPSPDMPQLDNHVLQPPELPALTMQQPHLRK